MKVKLDPTSFPQVDEDFPVETEFLRVFANDSDVGLVTIQLVYL